jgi:hypothetical protein
MNLLIFGSIAGLWIIGFIVMIEGLRNAPEAYEDERGFHYTHRPRLPQPDLHGILHHRRI